MSVYNPDTKVIRPVQSCICRLSNAKCSLCFDISVHTSSKHSLVFNVYFSRHLGAVVMSHSKAHFKRENVTQNTNNFSCVSALEFPIKIDGSLQSL